MPAPTQTNLIDVVDSRDEAVGAIPRGEVLETGQNFRTAHVFVLNARRDILLQRLSPTRDRHPCRWGSSVAAYLFAGETYREAAARRMREELGLTDPLRAVGKIGMRDRDSLKFVSLFSTADGLPTIREPGHIEQIEFWPHASIEDTVAEMPEMFTPTFVQLFRAFGRGLR